MWFLNNGKGIWTQIRNVIERIRTFGFLLGFPVNTDHAIETRRSVMITVGKRERTV